MRQIEKLWNLSPGVKLCAPLAIAAILLIVANVFSSSDSGRARRRQAGLVGKLVEIVEPMEGPAKRATNVVADVLDATLVYPQKWLEGFERQPDGEPDR